jgi:UDP-glucose 4-epimerase
MTKAARKEIPNIYGDGTQSREIIYVSDVINANILAATCDKVQHAVYNIGTGRCIQILQLWEEICHLSNLSLTPQFCPARAGDVPKSLADIGKAQKELNFSPKTSFFEGLRKTLEYYAVMLDKK